VFKKFLSHTFIYGLASQVPKIAGVVALPIITRDLTDNDYGIYGIILAYSSAIEVFSTLGLRVSFLNSFYKKESRFRKYWNHLYGFLFLWTIPFSLLQFCLIYFALSADVAQRGLTALLSVGASLFFGPISLVGSLYYQLEERPATVGIISLTSGLLTVLLNVFFISYLKLGYLGWFWSAFSSGLVVNLIYFYIVRFKIHIRPAFSFNRRFLKQSLKVSLPTIPHFYSIFLLNSSDRIIMNQLHVSTSDIGKYNVSYTVGNIFQSLAMASGFAITPLMMRCYKDEDERSARKLVFFLQGIFLFSTFLACVWMREIFYLLVKNETLNQMYYLGIIIVMAFNYRPIYYGAVNKLIYLEKTKILWRLSFIPGVINVVINLIFIPVYGYEFAAVSTFLTFTLMGVLGYFQKDFKRSGHLNYFPVEWALLNVALTAVAFYLRDIEIPWKIVTTLVVASMIIFVFYYFTRLRKVLLKA
jgi:O-antigen/teichoic acid export membrane protein